jgi:DNA-binding MarR family transcriptional regulator
MTRIKNEIKQNHFESPQQEAAINLLFTHSFINSQMKKVLKTYNVSPQQFNVLRILRGIFPEKVSSAYIKERMIDKESNITRLIDKLINKQYVSRDICPANRRKMDIAITEEGLTDLKGMDELVKKIDNIFYNIDDDEAVELNRLLDKIRE